MATTITLSEREIKVFSLVMSDYFDKKPPTLSAERWKSIATEVGIEHGDIARNAKYAFNGVVEKLGCKAKKGGKGDGGGKRKTADLKADDDGNLDEDAKPAKKTKSTKGTKGNKGKGAVKTEE